MTRPAFDNKLGYVEPEPTPTPQTDQPSTALLKLITGIETLLEVYEGDYIRHNDLRELIDKARASSDLDPGPTFHSPSCICPEHDDSPARPVEPPDQPSTALDDIISKSGLPFSERTTLHRWVAERDTLLAQVARLKEALERARNYGHAEGRHSEPLDKCTEWSCQHANQALANLSTPAPDERPEHAATCEVYNSGPCSCGLNGEYLLDEPPAPAERDATIGMLRSRLDDLLHHFRKESIDAAVAALTNTEPAARAWREQLVKPWRALLGRAVVRLTADSRHAWNCNETVLDVTEPRTDKCRCGLLTLVAEARSLLSQPDKQEQPDAHDGPHAWATTSEAEATQRNEP